MSEAVKIRLVADVPLGAFLSGGVDSSSVVSMMAQHSDSPVNTCSIGFDVPDFDEAAYAEVVARHLRTRHRTRRVAADSFELIERSEEHTSELQSLMRNSYAVFCLKKKTKKNQVQNKGDNRIKTEADKQH